MVRPAADAAFAAERNVIAGNIVAVRRDVGEAFFRGRAGERFAVRNSGANAVVEGVGDHGCEYMTGGVVVVLGPVGRNFAAGMSGGIALVLDEPGTFAAVCNNETVSLEAPTDEDAEALRRLLERHEELTGSAVAARILAAWPASAELFVKVMPHDLRRALGRGERLVEAAND